MYPFSAADKDLLYLYNYICLSFNFCLSVNVSGTKMQYTIPEGNSGHYLPAGKNRSNENKYLGHNYLCLEIDF